MIIVKLTSPDSESAVIAFAVPVIDYASLSAAFRYGWSLSVSVSIILSVSIVIIAGTVIVFAEKTADPVSNIANPRLMISFIA